MVVQYFCYCVYLATYTDCLESGYLKNHQNKNKNDDIKQGPFRAVQRSTTCHISRLNVGSGGPSSLLFGRLAGKEVP